MEIVVFRSGTDLMDCVIQLLMCPDIFNDDLTDHMKYMFQNLSSIFITIILAVSSSLLL